MMERPAHRHRASPRLNLALIAVPGWFVVAGTALSTWLYDKTDWSAVPFAAGASTAIAIFKLGEALIPEIPRADQKGRLLWFSDVASQMRLSRAYLSSCAETAGLPARSVVTLAWAPWWLALGFWVFLVLNAIIQLASRR